MILMFHDIVYDFTVSRNSIGSVILLFHDMVYDLTVSRYSI